EGEERDELVAVVSREGARQDAPAAFDWLTEAGSESAVEEGIGRVVGALSREDPEGGLEYIDSQSAGEVRDNAVQGYVYGNRDAPPAETIRLAETISGEESRQRAVTRVAYEWARQDPQAPLQSLDTTEAIGEASRERISELAERAAAGEEVGRGGFRGPGRR
ncbi:MAG: hypothetical protein MK133_02045, partial [Planctomycetes bacterium]|nr:hypothetical protein [Planctomycetota bacterium]